MTDPNYDGDPSNAPAPKEQPKKAPPQPWHPIHMPCPRCASKPKAQVTPKFQRILVIQCGKCGWKLDVEILRQAIQAEHGHVDQATQLDDLIED